MEIDQSTHETQQSEGGEADLHKHFDNCEKNPGHKEFIPVNDFNINHLKDGYQDNDIVELIKTTADLTVRLNVNTTSAERPEFWPNKNERYPFYDMRLGSGKVCGVSKWTVHDNLGTCKCQKCQHSDTPSSVWGEVKMYTATHVVFDDFEARNTTCRFFYDRADSPLVTLDGWKMFQANIEEDRCMLSCVTCDVDLLDKLGKLWSHWQELWNKVNTKYMTSRDEVKLVVMVSHPHGCPKVVSLGNWVDRCVVGNTTRYKYTTPTCKGSSGAYVFVLGYYDFMTYHRHVHSGVSSENENFSGIGWEFLEYGIYKQNCII